MSFGVVALSWRSSLLLTKLHRGRHLDQKDRSLPDHCFPSHRPALTACFVCIITIISFILLVCKERWVRWHPSTFTYGTIQCTLCALQENCSRSKITCRRFSLSRSDIRRRKKTGCRRRFVVLVRKMGNMETNQAIFISHKLLVLLTIDVS